MCVWVCVCVHVCVRVCTCVFLLFRFTVCMMYYGLTLHVDGVGSNKYISFFFMAVVELPALLIAIVVLKYIGRRTFIFWTMVMTTVFCTLSSFIAKWSTQVNGTCIYVYCTLFPDNSLVQCFKCRVMSSSLHL